MTQLISLFSVVSISYLLAKFAVDVIRGKYRC